MLLIGLEDCSTCKIAKGILLDIKYIELKKNKTSESTPPEIMSIKKALGKLNPSGHFPVVLSDDYSKIIETEQVLENLSKTKLQRMLES